MIRELHTQSTPFGEDLDPGDDSDLPGRSLPLSIDEIDEIVASPRMSVDERRSLLLNALDDLNARSGMDRIDVHDALRARLVDALAILDAPADGLGTPGAYAMDPDLRPEQPDEILERMEEEAENPNRD